MSREYSQIEISELNDTVETLNSSPLGLAKEVSELIKAFNSKKINEIDDNSISEIVDCLSYFHFGLKYTINDSKEIWRVRTSNKGQLFTHTDELKYPPLENNKIGRVTSPISSIFYSSSSPETAMAERRLKEGEYFHLSKYSVKPETKIIVSIIGEIDHIRRRSKTLLEVPNSKDTYHYVLDKLNEDILLTVYLVDAFYSDRLSRKGSAGEYRVTSAIASELFQNEGISGMIYPSVEHAGGFNFALTTDCYDQNIIPIQTEAKYLEEIYGYGMYKTTNWGPASINTSNNEILWPDHLAIHDFMRK